jgi:Ser/Thr protein kinase RdoA (MazF antagonist)
MGYIRQVYGNIMDKIITQFAIYGDLIGIRPFGNGHINSTYVSEWNQAGTIVRYLHQRINKTVFKHPEQVMHNIELVTNHIRRKLEQQGITEISRRVLTLVPLKEGGLLFRDETGEVWRTYLFIEEARTQELVETPSQAMLLGAAIGEFENLLSDLPGPKLYETIPQFHNIEQRYARFDIAITQDPKDRVHLVRDEITYLQQNRNRGMLLIRALNSKTVPQRICHNDTKMNNLLLSQDGNRVLCVTDLDTVMPGTVLFDLGDLVRTVTNKAQEDEPQLSLVQFNAPMYQALLKGYLSKAAFFLTEKELSLLEEAGRAMTQIMALRFLTDYLEGDVYYHISYPEHNLVRARNQIALMRSMDAQWDSITTSTETLRSEIEYQRGKR